MKYLMPFSGREDPKSWLESYQAAAKSEQWKEPQMLECISLKLKKKAKEWFTNLSAQVKPKTWEQFVTLFLEEFSDEDLQTTLAKCYKISQRKSETLKAYFNRYQKYLKKHDTAVKREVTIRYSKKLMNKSLERPLIPDPAITKKEREDFSNEETAKLSMNEDNRVEAFISGLRHYRSHFLITKPSTMEEVRQIVLHITRKMQWNTSKRAYSDSDSDSDNDLDFSESNLSSNSSDESSSKENNYIRMRSSSSCKKKPDTKQSSSGTATSNKKESSEIDSLIKQFAEMKIMLAEAVSKVSKLEQTSNRIYCKNCKGMDHNAQNCPQPCKNCQGSLGTHPFWKCPNYIKSPGPTITSSSSASGQTGQGLSPTSQMASRGQVAKYVLLEDEDSDFFSTSLKDLFAHEEPPAKHARKRVRVEELEDSDEDQVRLVNPQTTQGSASTSKPRKKRSISRPRKPKGEGTGPSPANKAAVQLMKEAKICLTLDQICDLAPSFQAEVRRLLVKPRKPQDSISRGQASEFINIDKAPENMYFNSISGDDSGCCPRTLIKVNNIYEVNSLLDGRAVPNIISLDLVKKLKIKELLQTHCKYITANGEKSQALGIAQNITINLLGRTLRIAAIVYNHNAFPLF